MLSVVGSGVQVTKRDLWMDWKRRRQDLAVMRWSEQLRSLTAQLGLLPSHHSPSFKLMSQEREKRDACLPTAIENSPDNGVDKLVIPPAQPDLFRKLLNIDHGQQE